MSTAPHIDHEPRPAEKPLTLVRGALSDLLAEETAEAMQARMPQLDLVTVPRVGHAPTLEEAEAAGAIDRFLERTLVTA